MARWALAATLVLVAASAVRAASFVEFESGQVRPLALSPDRSRLFAVNTPDDRLEVFAVDGSGNLTHTGSVAVGLEPVAVAARTNGEVWVVNHLSDSVSIVDVSSSPPRVVRTLLVGDEPRDIVFAAVFHSGTRTASINEVAVCNDASGSANNTVAPGCTVNGATLPGGTPNPDSNVQGVKGPEVGLVVKFNPVSGHWEDRLTRSWDPVIKFTIPDEDVFVIDASAATPGPPTTGTQFFSGVGTILFNMITNPVTGKIYVTNTEARNEIRFEGPGTVAANVEAVKPGTTGGPPFTVRGHLHEARVTVLDPASGSVSPRHLNKHLDTIALPNTYAQPGAAAKADSLATPNGIAITSNRGTLYTCAFRSSAVGMCDARATRANT